MKIYLDMCCIQRPLDDTSQLRIRLEAVAILGILKLCEAAEVELIAGEALTFECDANPDAVRRDFASQIISKATTFIAIDEKVTELAESYRSLGIKPMDALHLASAVVGQADYLCTCDDRFLRKGRTIDTASTKFATPLELASEIPL